MHKNIDEMQNVVIIGASGHGRMILDCIEKKRQYRVVGFVDSFKEKGSEHSGYEILGSEYDLPELMKSHGVQGVILALGNNWIRKTMADKIGDLAPELKIITVIHPRAIIGRGVEIGKGSVVMAGAIINANAIMGDFCILNTNASLGHDGKMGNFSSIASGVCTGGNLRLGRFSAVSLGANIIENIEIGEHSVVGAGSLVVKDVMPYSVVYGSPARFIRSRTIDDPYLSGDVNSNHGAVLVPVKKSGS